MGGSTNKMSGRYGAYDSRKNVALCNLFVSVLNNVGVEVESFATNSGKVTW